MKIEFCPLVFVVILLSLTCIIACNSRPSDVQKDEIDYGILDPNAYESLIGQEDVLLIDLRTSAEIARGMIKGARQIDYRSQNFKNDLDALDHEQTVAIYCASGIRSANVMALMKREGFKRVFDLKGGYRNWIKQNKQ